MTTAVTPTTETKVYLSRGDVAKRLGMRSGRSLSGIELPPPDVQIGEDPEGMIHKGWLPETIDAWHAERPGRGWWGGR